VRALLLGRRERRIARFQVGVDSLPALSQHTRIIRNQVPTGSARVAITMIVEPGDGSSGAFLAIHQPQVGLRLFLGEARRGLHIEACSGEQVSWQELLGEIPDHNLAIEPGFALRQAPRPEIGMQRHRTRRLLESGAEGAEEGIGLRHDVEIKLFILEIPGRAGRPGSEFVVPGAVYALEVIIA